MHPALRKGPLFTKKNNFPLYLHKTPPFSTFFLQKITPYFLLFLTKNTPQFPLFTNPPISFPTYGPAPTAKNREFSSCDREL